MPLKSVIKIIPFLVCWLLVNGCNNKSNHSSYSQVSEVDSDRTEIMNLAINSLEEPDSSARKRFLFSDAMYGPGDTSKQDSIEYFREISHIDSLKPIIDTARIYLFISDSTVKITNNAEKGWFNAKKDIKQSPSMDTSFYSLIHKLMDSGKIEPINISSINKKEKYVVTYTSQRLKLPRLILSIGPYSLSSIVFNKEKNMACLYLRWSCLHDDCDGIICFNKMGGKWKRSQDWPLNTD